jgi:hypothetical protein
VAPIDSEEEAAERVRRSGTGAAAGGKAVDGSFTVGFNDVMSDTTSHEIQICAASLDDLRDLLGISGDLQAEEIDLGNGLVLKEASLVKSSGFDTTQYLLQGLMTIVTSTSSAALVAYLKEKLAKKPGASAKVDGEPVEAKSSE